MERRILLFYKFVPLKDPTAVQLWQRTLAEGLNLKGRVLISEQGINATLGGKQTDLKQYVKQTKAHPLFKDTEFKWSNGLDNDFPKLSVRLRQELVTFDAPHNLKVTRNGVVGGGKRLKPWQLHELIKEKEVIFFDGRNKHESAIGRFKNAVVPDVKHTRDFKSEVKKSKYDALKNKPVVTYCTGGIRCEVLTVLMKQEGFKEVYQLDGGIAKYGEAYADNGLWEGALYVFDGRISTKFSDIAKDIGACTFCKTKTSQYKNCAKKTCNQLMLVCKRHGLKKYCANCSPQPVTI